MKNKFSACRLLVLLSVLTLPASTIFAETYYVSPKVDDSDSGTETAEPFRTIQKAADTVKPGDICRIQGGTYHETVVLKTSGSADKPIRFRAEEDQAVLLDGTEPVTGKWVRHKGRIYMIRVDAPVEQLYVDRRMTVFDVGPRDPTERNERNSRHLLIPTKAEPKKPWRDQFPLLEVQNANSLFCNNAVGNIVWRKKPLPASDRISHNLKLKTKNPGAWLVDPQNWNFRPREDSPLVDAGRPVPGFETDWQGKAPDVGAYEYGAEPWTAGITWEPKQVLGYVPAGYR